MPAASVGLTDSLQPAGQKLILTLFVPVTFTHGLKWVGTHRNAVPMGLPFLQSGVPRPQKLAGQAIASARLLQADVLAVRLSSNYQSGVGM